AGHHKPCYAPAAVEKPLHRRIAQHVRRHLRPPRLNPSWPLCEDRPQGSPAVLAACREPAQHQRHGSAQRHYAVHQVLDQAARIQSLLEEGCPRRLAGSGPRVLDVTDPIHQRDYGQQTADRDQVSGAPSQLAPLCFDDSDHDPCSSPVSWKKTSSSDFWIGRSSLTTTPAAANLVLRSALRSGSV